MIFVDTSALYAVLDRDDPNHQLATRTWRALLQGDRALIVSNYVVVEITALVQHRLGMAAVRVFCGDVLPALDVHWVSEDEQLHAQNALLAADRRQVSLADCGSFHVMRSRLVRTAFAFDPRFREQGFEVLPAPVKPREPPSTRVSE